MWLNCLVKQNFAIYILIYARLVEVDDFIANLWNVHLAVKQEGYAQVPNPILDPQPYLC